MGLIYADLRLSNVRRDDLKPIAVRALADTGAYLTCVPESVALQLELSELEKRTVTVADGRTQLVSYVGPIKLEFKNRITICGALQMGDEVLLGAVQMEDMDVVLQPRTQSVEVNPSSPNFPHMVVK